MSHLRNLTPHEVRIVRASSLHESWLVVPTDASGPARVSVESTDASIVSVDEHAGIPIAVPAYGEVTGLPKPEQGTLLIVSKMVSDACPERTDLVWPGDPVRDDAGRVIGCRCLHRRGAGSPIVRRPKSCADCPCYREQAELYGGHEVPAGCEVGGTIAEGGWVQTRRADDCPLPLLVR
jgi:hypothetical protein